MIFVGKINSTEKEENLKSRIHDNYYSITNDNYVQINVFLTRIIFYFIL